MSWEDVVGDALEATDNIVQSEEYPEEAKNRLQLLSRDALQRELKASDQGEIFAPVWFEKDGKLLSGSVLTLQDRVIFGWITGIVRRKNFDAVVPRDSIRSIEEETERRRGLGTISTLTVLADEDWKIIPVPLDGATMPLSEVIRGVLEGWLSIQRSSRSAEGEVEH